MEVLVDPLAMESYGLTQTELFNLVARNNKLVAAGALQSGQGRVPVKVPGVFESVADVLSLPVKVDGDRVVHFGDIAEVRRTYKDATSYARINGEPAIALEVVQRTGANIILTIERVRTVIEEERRLTYVGITRAQRTLNLTMARTRKRYGERIVCEPSRFMEELPDDEIEWIGGARGSQQKSTQEKGRSHLDSLKQLLG
jgi:hypothetical protein